MLDGFSARQFWIHAPGHGEIVRAHIPSRKPHEVLIRTLFTGISRGTESLVFRGDVPASQYADMRAPFQEGDLPGPVKYGYTNVGRVEETDLDSSDLTELFAWTREQFDERMQGSAIFRIGHERWIRNIAVALGNAPPSPEVTAALLARRNDAGLGATFMYRQERRKV